ncbi:MAG: proteasome subunit alpha [Gemmatimonadetes bacterium]|jgi:proteasome beta subunit|nr:proteasome subunit alpha [Gemmatimonadota bacterium]MBT6148415.1 proteasome subunit alpha [Gemmatimonadota bacterium]MBT7864387.1 proteasome subunit alpha [Gemmatimonadota bacterium]
MAEGNDFLHLLRQHGHTPPPAMEGTAGSITTPTEGTTILAVRYRDGVLVAGDRRATAGNVIVYDRAAKVLSVDDRSVLALSGSPANAYEIARLLEISFQHYRRTQLQELSLDGRLRTLSRLLRDNLPMAMQGIGAVVPIYVTFEHPSGRGEHDPGGKIFFYDVLGATFESVDFCTTGSGSPIIRGALYYQNRWEQPFIERDEAATLILVLKMLETAAEFDTATGGFSATAAIYPQVMRVTAEGISSIDEATLAATYRLAEVRT